MVRIILPYHLRTLAHVEDEVLVEVEGVPTLCSVLDALENRYPVLSGTIRDHTARRRRPFLRYYCCGMDYSNEPPNTVLPQEVASGEKPFMIIGAIAGG